jgi:hypothetical protein
MRLWPRRDGNRIPGLLLASLALCGAGAAARALAEPPGAGAAGPVDYNREIRPILAKNCFSCHGQDETHRARGLRLDRRESAVTPLSDGAVAIVAGDPEASELIARVTEEDESLRMPQRKSGPRLGMAEIALLKRWIAEGASYAEHWAFVPPADRPLPAVNNRSWPRSGIDFWILDRLEREGLKPSPEADREGLLRRVSLDLRGLPPTPGEMDALARDPAADAYEKAVDRFLADGSYGERWARIWLDLARYADSAGYGSDPLRPTIWRYRDWVINAFNANLPYDQFTIEQIAGDLLPQPSRPQRMATAFHRNTMTNTEGGTDDEEFRVAAVKDRVDTTGQVWMGLTFGCAKCHSHKYDPITQEEYYRLYAFYNQTADADRPDESPVIPAPPPALEEKIHRIDGQLATLRKQLDTTTPALADAQAKWETTLGTPPEWVVLEPASARSEGGAALESLPDASLRASGPNPNQDTYTVVARTSPAEIRAIRLEALPDPSLPDQGTGRGTAGRFVLSRFGAEVASDVADEKAPVGRFVRVELPGKAKILSLAEVEVYSEGANIALGGAAEQSSTDYAGAAARAIDGKTDGRYFLASSTTHTQAQDNPWWEVRLAEPAAIERIAVWNRTDKGVEDRLARFRVQVLDDDRKVVWQTNVAEPPKPQRELLTAGPRALAFARVRADFAEPAFDIAGTIDPKAGPAKSGWGVLPRQKERHEAVFVLGQPLAVPSPAHLTFRLEHRSKAPGANLGRFRLAVTSDPAAARWADVPPSVLAILATPEAERTAEQRTALGNHYRSIAPELKPLRDQIAALERSRPAIPNLPVMDELPADKRRETHLMHKGNYLDPGPRVEPGVLAAFHPLIEGAPRDRLGLARWLVDPRNPLTARVAVNRFWAQLFGVGLVETEEDFGTQGEPPSHPELLDWLAREYVRSGWDTKALLRLIVTSATYRQSSKVRPELQARDPRNRLLARAPRYRLEAEMVRDQALALSGLLSHELGGPSVYPPQPDGLWQAAFNGQRTWATSTGDDRYRRALYTFWRRTTPYPSMSTFDAPSRELCTVRRVRTNTPLQAFVTLNDPVYVEAAQALARRIVRDGGGSVDERVRFALKLCLSRTPDAGQVEVLSALFTREHDHYRQDAEAARALATEPLGALPAGMDPAELAAWTAVANVLLNLDGVLTKG